MQLPLAVSGWVFKEEFSEETLKSEKTSSDPELMSTDSAGAEVNSRGNFTKRAKAQMY